MEKKPRKPKSFFLANFELIKTQAAMGRGEYLKSFASMLGCTGAGSVQLAKALQKNHSAVYRSGKALAVFGVIEKLIRESKVLSKSCKLN